VKHKFTAEEDDRLTQIVARCGESNWKGIALLLGGRTCRQCRERWKNYLDPNLRKDAWTAQEDERLLAQYQELGSQWSLIAKHFPSRTDVACKNRWVVLTSHSDPPKRVRQRGRKGRELGEGQDQSFWTYTELELRQACEEADGFGLFGSRFILHEHGSALLQR
jgi:hypothetical protein